MARTWIKDAVWHMALSAIQAKIDGEEARVESLCVMMDMNPWQSEWKECMIELLRQPLRPVREYHLVFGMLEVDMVEGKSFGQPPGR